MPAASGRAGGEIAWLNVLMLAGYRTDAMRRFPVTLSNYTEDRDNNFNLIRIIAALAVLVTHRVALAIGTGAASRFETVLA